MSICLPNLRSTSVFKVYYGGTGQTSLENGGVVLGNGTDAVRCITGSEGQVLTWDNTLKTWIAKDPTGGTGTGVGDVPDIVLAPADNTPKEVFKRRISNKDFANAKYKNIDWDNSSLGSFRISNYDPSKKHLTIFNDSEQDLYISVANDENPKITIKFDDSKDLKDLNIEYKYEKNSSIYTLFDYKYKDLIDFHSYHTCSDDPAAIKPKIGYGKNYSLITCGTSSVFTLYLTPDYFSEKINQYNTKDSGSFFISLSSSSGKTTPVIFNISSSVDYISREYNIYTRVSSSTFISNSLSYKDPYLLINGFNLSDASEDKENIAPEEFSYIVYSQDSLTITDSEATLAMFGYFIKPSSDNKLLTVRVTETK